MEIDISIIIPTCNRGEILKKALESIHSLACDGSFTYRFLIVDNNSTDKTKEVVENFRDQYKVEVKYFFEPQQGISCARNRGIREAQGEFIVFTDDDCLPNYQWLGEIFECFKETQCDAIGGRILPSFPPHTPKWVEKCKDLLCGPIVFHDYGEETKLYEKPMLEFVGANIAFRREVFQKYGYFRTDLGVGQGTMGEETEFFQRLQSQGCKIYYCGKAVVWHPVEFQRLSLKYLAKWNIGLGKYRFLIDEKGVVAEKLARTFGVPRYLIAEMAGHCFLLMLNIFNRRNFLREWKNLTVKIGRASAMQQKFWEEKNQ